jgi:hypothetical protein
VGSHAPGKCEEEHEKRRAGRSFVKQIKPIFLRLKYANAQMGKKNGFEKRNTFTG